MCCSSHLLAFKCGVVGSEWVLEDVIYLRNINIPRLQPVDPKIDLAYLQEEGEHWLKKRKVGIETLTRNLSHDDLEVPDLKDSSLHERYQPNIQGIYLYRLYVLIKTDYKSDLARSSLGPQLCNFAYSKEVDRATG